MDIQEADSFTSSLPPPSSLPLFASALIFSAHIFYFFKYNVLNSSWKFTSLNSEVDLLGTNKIHKFYFHFF